MGVSNSAGLGDAQVGAPESAALDGDLEALYHEVGRIITNKVMSTRAEHVSGEVRGMVLPLGKELRKTIPAEV